MAQAACAKATALDGVLPGDGFAGHGAEDRAFRPGIANSFVFPQTLSDA
jgi:hypothetical protein